MGIADYPDRARPDPRLAADRRGEGNLIARGDRDLGIGDQGPRGAVNQLDTGLAERLGQLDPGRQAPVPSTQSVAEIRTNKGESAGHLGLHLLNHP